MSASGATERLYYTNAYLSEFDARVVRVADDGRRVYLDRTAFYPTSGGQPNDVGTLGGHAVADVVSEEGAIAHVLREPAKLEGTVAGKIDWARRFDHMQQHTGQHLLSAVFEDLFGAKTVSVHFGETTSTLDVEADSMSQQSLEKAERQANVIVAENRPVSVKFEDATAAKGLRKPTDRTGIIRVVTITDLDRSACGGTHVRATGEIGAILVRGAERTKNAIRIEFVCGLRAVARAHADHQALSGIATSLSTSLDAAATQVAAQASQLKESEQARRRLEREVAAYRAGTVYDHTAPDANGVRVVVASEAAPMDMLRALATALIEKPRVAFAARTGEGQLLVATSEDSGFDAGKILREAVTALGGKGGGSPRLAQGSAGADKATQALDSIRAALTHGR